MDGGWSGWFAIALVAILVRAFVPSGYMASAERGPGFVICSGQTTTADAQKDGDPFHHAKVNAESCPFAVLQLALESQGAPRVDAPVFLASAPVGIATPYLSPGRGLAAPPPPSTGPPARL